MAGDKNLSLESLRGLAAFGVVLYHFQTTSPLSDNLFVRNSLHMVDFFFVLSGYVIALNYRHRLSTPAQIATFQRRRFWRLYPLHFVTLLVFLGIETAKYLFERSSGVVASVPAFSESDGAAFVHNLLLTQALFLDALTFNAPSWSISTEFYTYLVFACVVWLFEARWNLVAILVVCVSGVILHSSGQFLHSQSLLRCLYSFFLGALTHAVWVHTPRGGSSLLATVGLVLSVLGLLYLPRSGYDLLLSFIFCAFLFEVARLDRTSWFSRALETRPLVHLGTISYSLYLTHAAVWWVIVQVLRFVFHVGSRPEAGGGVRLDIEPFPATIATILGVTLILAVSHASYRLVEDPFRHGLAAWRAKRHP